MLILLLRRSSAPLPRPWCGRFRCWFCRRCRFGYLSPAPSTTVRGL